MYYLSAQENQAVQWGKVAYWQTYFVKESLWISSFLGNITTSYSAI